MAKRISRKLLVGLGSIVTFGAVGTVSGFGVKSIIDSTLNHNQVNQLNVNSIAEEDFSKESNYNVATKDMFIDTRNLKRFHFGTTQTGQKVTPWGWLGVFEDSSTVRTRIALTGWNGEIIWVNEDYKNDSTYNVYDMQYDWNTNLLLVLRTKADNGFYQRGSSTVPLRLDILDAKTGRRIEKSSIDASWFASFQQSAINKLDDYFLQNLDSNANLRAKSKNLYYLDVAYSPEKKALLATWMPNYMQMADQRKNAKNDFSLPTFYDVITSWKDAAPAALLNLDLVSQNKDAKYKRQFDLVKSYSINKEASGEILLQVERADNWVSTKQIYLLTNPFFTPSSDGNAFIMHLIGARISSGNVEVIHKSVGWKIVFDGGATDGEIYNLNFDKVAQKWSNNGFLELDSRGSFAKAKGWRTEFVNANLRVNKNMFNQNSIVFAYPFATSSHMNEGQMMPSFNVAQLKIDPTDGGIDTATKETNPDSSINYGFASQINKYYDTNQSKYNDKKYNNIYPTPKAGESSDNVNHSYNRLISVSPFDNTIIYAAKPNLREDIFDQQNRNNRSKWAGFWVANSWDIKSNKGKYYRPLIVAADPSISPGDSFSNNNSKYMLMDVNDLYATGFAFDIRSLVDVDGKKSLNLYFNQTGNGVNDNYGNNSFVSSKIGMLNDVLSEATPGDNTGPIIWVKNVAEKYTNPNIVTAKKLLATGIDKKSYSSIIHSRADLTKWYTRTWANSNYPSNMYGAEAQVNLTSSSSERAVLNRNFDSNNRVKLEGSEFNSLMAVDLLSAWKDKDNTVSKNYNRLIVKRPIIKTGQSVIENHLGLVTTYEMPSDISDLVTDKVGWGISKNKLNLILQKVETAQNSSVQIFSAWQDSYKMEKAPRTTDELNDPNKIAWQQLITPKWLDKITTPNLSFGNKNNNNISRNGTTALRLMIKLTKPEGDLPKWFRDNIDDKVFFNKAYPIQSAYQNETTFKDIINDFANKKARALDLSDSKNSNTAVSLGNLKMEVYLELNPKFASYTNTDKIYKISSGPLSGAKALVDKTNGQKIIYKDDFNNGRTIYNQTEIAYESFENGGFGKDGSAIRNEVQPSWKNNIFDKNKIFNIRVSTDYNELPDTLVRKSANNNDPIFTFDYKNGDPSKIEITPTPGNEQWFSNHFLNFNRMLNLFVQFQYSNSDSGDNWQNLGSRLTDKLVSQQMSNGVLWINSAGNRSIRRLRFRLIKETNNNDRNLAIDIKQFDPNNAKYISSEHRIAIEKFYVDPAWIRSIYFANPNGINNKTIETISQQDIDDYIRKVIEKSTQSSPSVLSKVTLKFKYNNGQYLSSKELFELIKQKRESNEPFSISKNGDGKGDVISASFALVNANDKVQFLKTDGTVANSTTDITNNVVSNLISRVDLNDYIDQLMSDPLVVKPAPIRPGEFNTNASTVQFPTNKATSGFFSGMSFDEIKNKLINNLGVILQFKGYNPDTGLFDPWTEDISSIRYYSPTYPIIQIGFKQIQGWATQLVKDSQIITDDSIEWPLNLALVKLVNLPSQTAITQMITDFNAKNVFSGNTKNLSINSQQMIQAKEIVVNALKAASGNNGYDALSSKIELVFKLGNFTINSNDGYFTADELKKQLSSNTNDIDSNELKMKVRLIDEKLFTLADNLKTAEFTLFFDNNKIIKKYLNGILWESALRDGSGITLNPGSSKNNLDYNFKAILNDFQTGEYTAKELKLEYQLVGKNTNNNWIKGALPKQVDAGINEIKIRISSKESDPNNPNLTFVYGPQISTPDSRSILSLDLNLIPTILEIDSAWFSQIEITNSILNLNNLNPQDITNWEKRIWKKVNNDTGVPAELVNGVSIQYKLELANNQQILYTNATNLVNGLKEQSRKFDSQFHHGIFKLWDGANQNSGFKIKATFIKQKGFENKIQFQTNNQNVDNNEPLRTGIVNTSKIQTTLNLSAWITNLINNPTSVSGTQPGIIPSNGLIPPVLNGSANSNLFVNETFANIDNWLKSAGVTLLWNKNPNNNTNQWNTTNNTNEYDATLGKLWFALDNQSSNMILELGNNRTILNPGQSNKNNSFEIKLDAIKIINLHPNDAAAIIPFINGNTKYLNVDLNKINNEIRKILNRQGSEFANAPLTILIKVGNEPFVDFTEIKKILETKSDDLENGLVVAKFAIKNNDPNSSKFQIVKGGEAEQNLKEIKIYINDQNTFDDLQQVVLIGSDRNLKFDWTKTKFNVDPKTGSLSYIPNSKARAVGLKIQYTFKNDLPQDSTSTGSDPYQNWVDAQPNNFNANNATDVNIRIQVKDNNKYVYEKIESPNQIYKFSKTLNDLGKTITVDRNWLNKPITNSPMDISNFDLSTYVTNVNNDIPQVDKSKLKIVYGFDGGTPNLDVNQLKVKMKEYGTSNINNVNKNFGFLQFWNGKKGVKLTSTFIVNPDLANSSNYTIEWSRNDSAPMDIDTSKIISTINLASLVSWLKTTSVAVTNKPGTTNEIQNLTFQNIVASGSPLNGKSWNDAETVLENLGIKIEYKPVYSGAPNNWNDQISSINKYDNNGKFQIRFNIPKSNTTGGINIKVALGNSMPDLVGNNSSDSSSNAIDVLLDIVREIQINTNDVNTMFISKQGAWNGNTKYFNINQTDEESLINKIKQDNHNSNPTINPSFKDAKLQIVYYIGNNPTTSNSNDWKLRQDFINELKSKTDDQISNQISFKFRIDPKETNSKFSVSNNQIYTFNPNDNQGSKIPFFVHTNQLETQANSVRVNGTQDQLNWDFNAFGQGQFEVNQNNEVFIKSKNRNLLKLEFTTKNNPQYDDQDVVADVNQIGSKWVSKFTTSININELDKLYIRIKPAHSGVIYQADYTDINNNINPNPKGAVHKVLTTVQKKIIVNKNWISSKNLVDVAMDITSLGMNHISDWENKIYNEIKNKNGIDDTTARKIKIKFYFDNSINTKYSAQELFNKIDDLRTDYGNDSTLGILQLFNGNKGTKINAIFEKPGATNSDLIIRAEGKENIEPTDNDLSATINTNSIYTTISMVRYIETLKNTLTQAEVDPNIPGKLINFTPPNGTNPNSIFDNKSYDLISKRLKDLGITIDFSKDQKTWQSKELTKEYDIQTNALYLRFTIPNGINIRLQLTNLDQIQPGENSQQTEIKLPLAVPKYILIDQNQNYWDLTKQFNFSGNTKSIIFSEQKINDFLTEIKKSNANAGGDESYNKAPLEILFQIGSNSQFVEMSQLKKYLLDESSKNIDRSDRFVKFKFAIKKGEELNWQLQNDNVYTLLEDTSNRNSIKVYVNDAGVFEQLSKMVVGGTNDQLVWNWPELVNINSDGILNPNTNKPFGKGLKFEFTFKDNLDINANVGTDVETEWVGNIPTSYDANKGFTNVYLRIKLTNQTYYEYENINKLITLSLSEVNQKITLNVEWLNKLLNGGQELNIENLDDSKIKDYEKEVKKAAEAGGINQSLLDKFEIRYFFNFNNNLDESKLVNSVELIKKIEEYQSDKNQTTFGILQLWNQTSGIKIVAKFVDANLSDKYAIETTGNPNYQELDTSKIITTIDFSKVIKWLTETKKIVEVQGDKDNAKFIIPVVKINDELIFNGKRWDEISNALSLFGIQIQYRPVLDLNQAVDANWVDQLSSVTKYNENIGKIQIRFKFDNKKAKNIKFKINTNEISNGAVDNVTKAFDLDLAIRLNVKIYDNFVNEFTSNPNVISGNTKYLKIDSALEKVMIDKIIKQNALNNINFNNAGLVVKYKLDNQSNWKDLNTFINDLKTTNTDQTSNKVIFKFEVTNNSEFQVDNNPRVLFDPATETNHENWKVKLFINNGTWENDASTVNVTGKTSSLKWEWNSLRVKENTNGKVEATGLQVEFTTKNNAQYNDPDVSENETDLNNKWISVKPSKLDATINKLWIRIKAKAGYIYGPAYTDNINQIVATATIHLVQLNIKREILVDPKKLLTTLSLGVNNGFVNDISLDTINNFVQDGLNQVEPSLQQHVTVKFTFNGKNNLDSAGLFREIQNIISSNNNPNYGVLQLWNGTQGTKIEANYSLVNPNDNYELITADNSDPMTKQTVITDHIGTKINLIKIVNDLKTKKIQFDSTNKQNNRAIISINEWIMPDILKGSEQLNGISWEAFENRLNEVGVLIKARVVHNPDNPQKGDWKLLNELKEYDDTTLQLALRFEIQVGGANIVLSVENENDTEYDPTGNSNSNEFKMNIKAPATVTVTQTYLTTFTTTYQISGNTKNINLDSSAEEVLKTSIYNENLQINPNVFNELKDRLIIEYYLGETTNNLDDTKWMTKDKFINYLANETNDQKTNAIWYRLNVINPEDDSIQSFNIDKNPKQLIAEDISKNSKVKIFINDNGLENRIKTLQATGSTDDIKIKGWDLFEKQMPKGLKSQWANIQNPIDSDWTYQPPKTLNSNKDLWIRFKSDEGYVYENAIKDSNNQYTEYSQKHAVNTDGLKVILKVQTDWLKKIIITQNTSNPDINEEQTLAELKKILPKNKPDLIELQYHIKGENQWFKKDDFISKLKLLSGSKDQINFILKREEIEVKFAIQTGENEYALNIDGDDVDGNNERNYYVQLVKDDKNLNANFEGYINIDKITNVFNQDNFKIQGSTSRPNFIVTNRQQLENLFMPYAGKQLFDIQYSTEFKNNSWVWDDTKSILLDNGQIIGDDGLINQQVQIGADKKFALRFVSKDTKYKVYKNGQEQNGGYVLDLSDNVKITIEITNPFTQADKTLGIWTLDGKDAKYFQGNGGFKIVVANKNNFEVDNKENPKLAQQFLKESGLNSSEKDALEFVYHIFGANPSQSEINQIKKTINDHNSKDWVQFSSTTMKNNDQWSNDLGLKVGDYVAVAIRVKKEFSTGDNIFVLKDNDNSMILPIMQVNGKEYKAGRISGYKIKTDSIEVDQNSVTLISMINPELPPLDGWTWLSKLNLKQDDLGNYLGVDLDLQLYSEFYEKAGKILISGSGAKIVKRVTSGENISDTGFYKDASGQNIKDDQNQDIKIYKNTKTNRLSNPIKSNSVTKNKLLENLGNGVFRLVENKNNLLEQGKLSLFRNQDVDLKLVANKGEGTEDWPDFYLDNNQKIISLKEIISPQIKYPIENEKQITYSWNYDDFLADKIQYEKVGNNLSPEDGAAKIKTIFKLLKKEGNAPAWTEITDNTAESAMKKLDKTLEDDFGGQLKFVVTRSQANGSEISEDTNNIYKYNNLKNKDRIVLKILAKDDDLYYAEAPRPLIINVSGLTEAAPDQNKLQHLRVKQNGNINGQGSFKVLVSNPNDDEEDDRSILKGWKFMVRVWDKDPTLDENNKRKIKIDWTDDQARIRGLANGDKVEWKLVSEDGNPVKDAYYNTIALGHESINNNGSIKYNFAQIEYKNGDSTYTKVKDGIGAYPDADDQYPENSGFIISGLKSAIETFQISKENFAKVISQLQPSYVGINTQGTIHFDQKYFDENYWVNTNGELYVKKDQVTFEDAAVNEIGEIPLTEFLDHVTFYTHDPVIANYQGGFKFSGNDININNHLTNGDQMWATFDTTGVNDNSDLNNNDPTTSLTTRLLDVSGLKDIIDPMSPLWYVLMALAGIATLGTAALIAFLVARHKKLKGKN